MMRFFAPLLAAICLATPALAGDRDFTWPVPTGWKHETIPFPLGFAPQLKYRGTEELRFMPGFFDPKAPDYWSYTFVWWLDGSVTVDRKRLESDLTGYFAGLCNAVGGSKFHFDPSHFRVNLQPAEDKSAGTATAFIGTGELYDPFATGKELTISLRIRVGKTTPSGHTPIQFLAAPGRDRLNRGTATTEPTAKSDPVSAALIECARQFHPE